MFAHLWHQLPFRCILCHQSLEQSIDPSTDRPWCQTCQNEFPKFSHCPRCGLFNAQSNLACGQCLKDPPIWDSLTCVSDYVFPYDRLLHLLKYQGQYWLARHCISLLTPPSELAPFILAVPMHWQRRIQRGFNHSQLLADAFCQRFQTQIFDGLTRQRATQKQQGLTRRDRLTNLKHAFHLKQKPPEHIALIDDVVTTGSTVSEISALLKSNGTKRVDIICICRTRSEKHIFVP